MRGGSQTGLSRLKPQVLLAGNLIHRRGKPVGVFSSYGREVVLAREPWAPMGQAHRGPIALLRRNDLFVLPPV